MTSQEEEVVLKRFIANVVTASDSDADSQMLTDYIVVMLKQELNLQKTIGKTSEAIIDYLTQQLEDFLKDQTRSCVERIVNAINNKEIHMISREGEPRPSSNDVNLNGTEPPKPIEADEEFAPIYSDSEEGGRSHMDSHEDDLMEDEDRHRSPERREERLRSVVEAPETSRLGRRDYRERLTGRFRSDDIIKSRERKGLSSSDWRGGSRYRERTTEDDFPRYDSFRRGREMRRGARPSLRRTELSGGDRSLIHTNVVRVEKLPTEQCDETMLRDHFSKFGSIEGISVDRSHGKCHIVFQSEDAATAAVRSLEAVLNNRFIRVYRARPEEANRIKTSLGNGEFQLLSSENSQRQQDSSLPAVKVPTVLPTTFKLDLRQQQKQETLKNLLDVQRQKQELVHKLMQEQKQLMDSLSADTTHINEQDRKELLEQVDSLSQTILRHRLQISQVSREVEKVSTEEGMPLAAATHDTTLPVSEFPRTPSAFPNVRGARRPFASRRAAGRFSSLKLDLRPKPTTDQQETPQVPDISNPSDTLMDQT